MSENVQRILLVQPEAPVLDAAAQMGFETWSLRDADMRGRQPGRRPCERQLTVDCRDVTAVEALLVATARAHRISHIVYVGDSSPLRCAVEQARTTLSPGRADALHRLHDPASLRRILNQSGVSVVNAVPVRSVQAARGWAAGLPLPLVVKAVWDGATTVIRSEDDFEAWAARSPAMPCVMEEFLAGPRIIVETLSHAGMHHVVGMTGAGDATPDGVDLLHPAALSEADTAEIRTIVRALLDLTGHGSGPVRTHVVLTEHGPRIATAEAYSGFGPIARLRHAATGRHPVEDVLASAAGRPVRPATARRFAALARLKPAPDGPRLAEALAAVKARDHVHDARIVDTATALKQAEVIVYAGSPTAASERLSALRGQWTALADHPRQRKAGRGP